MNKDKGLHERILIVDDENTVLLFLSLTLKQLGYNKVEQAINAEEGFKIATRTKPALVIADIHMPGENGLELLKKVKDCMPDTCCIVMTASDELRDAVASLNQGVDRYLLKPLNIEELQHAVTSSLEKRQLILENRRISFHDALTGLYNRRYMEEEMRRLDTERQLPISIIMTDVNGLKKVNDTYGHRAGDELLEKAAGILKDACRKEDIIARWGGDEFLILLPKTCTKTAVTICRRINDICRKTFLQNSVVSIALGVAEKNDAERPFEDVIKDADRQMYEDKMAKREKPVSGIGENS